MRYILCVLSVLLLVTSGVVGQATSCSTYNATDTPNNLDWTGTQHHVSGHHEFWQTLSGGCAYYPVGSGNTCASTCYGTTGTPATFETGTLDSDLYEHNPGISANAGSAQAPNGGVAIQCGATVAAVVTRCLLTCAATISFSGGVNGIGMNISFPSTEIFEESSGLTTTCAPEQTQGGSGSCQPPSGGCGNGQYWNPTQCTCQIATSPIVIDTTGKGFHLTSASGGVMFDIEGDGHPIKVAWTVADSGNAWLALDRNRNGIIDSGTELFGNYTKQSPSDNPNGYLALAEFDKPENGGNGDGIIDYHDAVYAKLLLWIDANHDGISQPNELHSLPELGVYSIGLRYQEEPLTDQFGNQFRYRGVLNPNPLDGTSKDGRYTYDVFLANMKATGARAVKAQDLQADHQLK